MKLALKYYTNSTLFSIAVFVLLLTYQLASFYSLSPRLLNIVNAYTGFTLIGFSFALSGMCYFWNRFDKLIIYRKYIGIVGLGFVFLHTIQTLFFLTDLFPFPEYYSNNLVSFVSALIGLVIFTMMLAISNQLALKKFGSKTWKTLLRIGYIGYVFAIVHFGIKQYEYINEWFVTLSFESLSFPPLSLIMLLFSGYVIGLRLAITVSKWLKKKA